MRIVLLLMLLLTGLGLAQEKCHICGSNLELEVRTYTEAANVPLKVCAACVRKRPKCDVCEQPSGDPPHRDGRHICKECRKVGIFNDGQARVFYNEVRTWVARLIGGKQRVPDIQVVDKDEIQTKMVESGRAVQVLGFYRAYNPEMIYVLSGHSKPELAPIVAHEYVHAWQSENCPAQDRSLTEGFATWVQYKYLMSQGKTVEARGLINSGRPDYDEGLNACLKIEKQKGVKGLLKYVTTETKI